MLAKKIAYNTIISAASRILGTAIALTTLGLITRYLGQDGFGNYSIVMAFLYIFSVLADLGLYSITLREISKEGADESEIVSHAFSFRFFSGLFIFGLAPAIAWLFPYSIETKIGIAIASFGFWFLSNTQVLVTVFQKYLKMERVAMGELAGRVVQIGLIVFFIAKNMGFFNIILATSISSLANFLLIFIFVQKYTAVKIRWNLPYWKRIMKASFPLALSAVFVMIYFKLDTLMLSLMKPASDVGIYGVAYKILENLIFFPALFVGLIMPLLAKYALTDAAEFKRVAQRGLDVLLIFALPMALGGLVLSGPIIALIAGPGFGAAAGVLDILIFATAVIFMGSLFSNMIIALEKQKALAKIYAVGAAVNFGVNLILIPRFSYWGAASSTLFTEALVTFLMLVVIKRTVAYIPRFGIIFKIFLSSAAMAIIVYLLRGSNIFVLLIIAFIAYFPILLASRAVSVSEVWALIRRQT
jgi:O-antigen/teichoic acid export membrane protein